MAAAEYGACLQAIEAALPTGQPSMGALAPIAADLKGVEEKFAGLTALNEEFGRTPKQGVQKDFFDTSKDMDRAVRSLLVGASGAVGIFVSFYATRVLAQFLFAKTDASIYGLVVVLLAAIALIASLFPALRVLRIHPLTALRHE